MGLFFSHFVSVFVLYLICSMLMLNSEVLTRNSLQGSKKLVKQTF